MPFQIDNIPYILVTPDRGLFFPSVDEIRNKILDIVQSNQSNEAHLLTPIIMDMSQVREMDYTAASVSSVVSQWGLGFSKESDHFWCCVLGNPRVDQKSEEVRTTRLLLLRWWEYWGDFARGWLLFVLGVCQSSGCWTKDPRLLGDLLFSNYEAVNL